MASGIEGLTNYSIIHCDCTYIVRCSCTHPCTHMHVHAHACTHNEIRRKKKQPCAKEKGINHFSMQHKRKMRKETVDCRYPQKSGRSYCWMVRLENSSIGMLKIKSIS